MNKQLKVLVGGATGYVGGHVLCELHDKGYWVRALARDPKRLEGKKFDDVFVGEATRAETLKGVCNEIDVVFSSIGVHSGAKKPRLWEIDYQANINLFEEARRSGVKHAIFISTMGGPAMARYSDIAAAREKVVEWLKASGMDYTIFRPTAFYNDITFIFDKIIATGVSKLYGNPEVKMNPIHGKDFADLVAKAIETPDWKNIERDVGGPEIFTRRQIAELAFKVLGKDPVIQVKPLWQFAMLTSMMKLINFNVYHVFKFLLFTWRTPWMAATRNGHRRLEGYWRELKDKGHVGTGSITVGL